MIKFTSVKIPKEGFNSIRVVQANMALQGIRHLPEWLQELLIRGKPLSTSNISTAGIVLLALIERGKSLEEIKRMSREEVNALLKEGNYPIEV